ncbi:hypothetical protein FACS1894184_10180 [Clostridia bacterium]|nr:hypothetical protein FACS1894184_10180 [Clostridia bacterium]
MTEYSYRQFIPKLLKMGHESPFEMMNITLGVVTDRAVMTELTRHRHVSFCVESQRHVKRLEFIEPMKVPKEEFAAFLNTVSDGYDDMLSRCIDKQYARAILPNCTATRVVMSANVRAWRELFDQRTTMAAYPPMRELMCLALRAIYVKFPEAFCFFFRDYMERLQRQIEGKQTK